MYHWYWASHSSDTTGRTMRALPKHPPDLPIADENLIPDPVQTTDQAALRPRRWSKLNLRTVVAVIVATEYFAAALASYFASLIYGLCFVGNALPATEYIVS